jgi:RecA-family ATPase
MREAIDEAFGNATGNGTAEHDDDEKLRVFSAEDLLREKIPPRDYVLEPILRSKDIAMIYGPRGLGKTQLALGLSYAIASGGDFLKWRESRVASCTWTARCKPR